MNNFIYVCGSNICKQIYLDSEGELPYICSPIRFSIFKLFSNEIKSVQISLSHIFWLEGKEWKLSGYKARHLENYFSALTTSSLLRSREKRSLYLGEHGGVMVCATTDIKKLHLQQMEELPEDIQMEDIVLEDNCLLCLSKSGRLFSSGIEIPLLNIKISEISAGKEHCLALTTMGKVLSWGSGMRGQLGDGEIHCSDDPQPIASLEGLQIIHVYCGGWHSAALSSSGDVYLWGWNDVGQLGFPSRSLQSDGVKWDDILDFIHLPACHSLPSATGSSDDADTDSLTSCEMQPSMSTREKNYANMINPSRCSKLINVQAQPKLLDYWDLKSSVKKVACGDRHTLFLLDNETAWSTGWNMYGQLGLGSTISQDQPQIVALEAVEDIFAGGWNSVFVAASPSNK